jgi:hypothetical protein
VVSLVRDSDTEREEEDSRVDFVGKRVVAHAEDAVLRLDPYLLPGGQE